MNVAHPFEGEGPHCSYCGLTREEHTDVVPIPEHLQAWIDRRRERLHPELNMDRSTDRQPTPNAPLEAPMIVDLVKVDLEAMKDNIDRVAVDLDERREQGIRKYGQALRPHNGRDAMLDAYGEILDLVCYIRQFLEERDT